jgi:hypothetical protein
LDQLVQRLLLREPAHGGEWVYVVARCGGAKLLRPAEFAGTSEWRRMGEGIDETDEGRRRLWGSRRLFL